MKERHLHIITHDVPWPADYGGVVDLFYKIKALHDDGVHIYLHCFYHNRPPQELLKSYCTAVYYYKREMSPLNFSLRIPFIVNSRKNPELIRRLHLDTHPVLIEGIHCSYYLYKGELGNRQVVLRLHNTEFEYYHQLARHENNPLKRYYFHHESKLLKGYEKELAGKVKIIAVSEQDVQLYKALFGAPDISYLPVFTPFTDAAGIAGKGCYCLYHGNLSINENEEAAIWLLQNVFNQLEIPFVIAGKNPSEKLTYMAHQHPHTCLVANPGDKELQDMIGKAQVNILPSFNNTGVKLKLLNALFNGRHCLVNRAGVAGSGLERVCQVAEDADDFKTAISYLYHIPFTIEEKNERQQVLQQLYCNRKSLQLVEDIFWPAGEGWI